MDEPVRHQANDYKQEHSKEQYQVLCEDRETSKRQQRIIACINSFVRSILLKQLAKLVDNCAITSTTRKRQDKIECCPPVEGGLLAFIGFLCKEAMDAMVLQGSNERNGGMIELKGVPGTMQRK